MPIIPINRKETTWIFFFIRISQSIKNKIILLRPRCTISDDDFPQDMGFVSHRKLPCYRVPIVSPQGLSPFLWFRSSCAPARLVVVSHCATFDPAPLARPPPLLLQHAAA